jgi:hypothetical protein
MDGEHLCECCLRGEPRSYQVDRWFSWLQRAVHTMTALFAGSSLARLDPRRAHTNSYAARSYASNS